MKVYVASTIWNGSLNIGNMKAFSDEKSAYDYLNAIAPRTDWTHRIYELDLDSDEKCKNITRRVVEDFKIK